VDESIQELIHRSAGEDTIRHAMRERGWEDLRANGLRLADRGISPLEEVLRVTHLETDTRVRAEGQPARADA